MSKLQQALNDPLWKFHEIGNIYSMRNMDGGISEGWKIAYYPIFQVLRGGEWIEVDQARALIERPMGKGTDFREVPIIFLTKTA